MITKLKFILFLILLFSYQFSNAANSNNQNRIICEDKIINNQIVKRCYEGTPISPSQPSPTPTTNNPINMPSAPGNPFFPSLPGTLPTNNPSSNPGPNNPTNSHKPSPPKPINTCTTSAHRILPYVPDATNQMWVSLWSWEKFSILIDTEKMPLINRPNYYMSVVEGGAESMGADIQVTISECPGDFNSTIENSPHCGRHTTQFGDGITFKVGEKKETRPPTCWLKPGTTKIYYNVRLIKLPTPNPPGGPGEPSCPEGYQCKFVFALTR